MENVLLATNTLFNNEKYGDVCFNVLGTKYYANRALLAAQSSYFEEMFFGSNKNTNYEIVINDEKIAYDIFHRYLNFLYTGYIRLHQTELNTWFHVAEKFQTEALRVQIQAFISREQLTVDNMFTWLHVAVEQKLTHLRAACEKIFFSNAHKLMKSDMVLNLSQDIFLALMSSSDLGAREVDVFHTCMKWCLSHCGHIQEKANFMMAEHFFPIIRFSAMTLQDITEVIYPLNLVPDRVLLNAIAEIAKNGMKRVNTRNGFIDIREGELKTGIFQYFGGEKGFKKHFDVIMSSSGGTSTHSSLFNPNNTSNSLENSYSTTGPHTLTIMLKTFTLRPHSYKISQENDKLLRTWTIEGSEDGKNWETLSTHVDDNTFTPTNLTATFVLKEPNVPFYNMLRLSTSSDYSIFHMEFFGDIKLNDSEKASRQARQHDSVEEALDGLHIFD